MNKLKEQVKQLINIVDNMEIQGKNNLINYKLKNILSNEVPIKVCERCGKPFIPPYNSLCQKYCCDDCRYNSTKQNRKYTINNTVTRPIEMLAKKIHQKRYYCKQVKKGISKEELESRLAVYKKLYYQYTHPMK